MPKPFETKQDEIEYFQRFYDNLPAGSYLKDILEGVPEIIESMIKSDWNYSLGSQVNDLYEAKEGMRKEIAQLGEANNKLIDEVAKLNERMAASQKRLREFATTLHGLYSDVYMEAAMLEPSGNGEAGQERQEGTIQ